MVHSHSVVLSQDSKLWRIIPLFLIRRTCYCRSILWNKLILLWLLQCLYDFIPFFLVFESFLWVSRSRISSVLRMKPFLLKHFWEMLGFNQVVALWKQVIAVEQNLAIVIWELFEDLFNISDIDIFYYVFWVSCFDNFGLIFDMDHCLRKSTRMFQFIGDYIHVPS